MNSLPKIVSRDNQKLKLARAVRDGREKDLVFVEGVRLCEEILRSNLSIRFGLVTGEFLQGIRGKELTEELLSKFNEVSIVEEKIFRSLADTDNSQGIIIISEKPETGKSAIEKNLSGIPFLLLLHQINNPSNLGAIFRTAEAVGIRGIITTKGTADMFAPKTLRAGMGSNLRVPGWTNADFFEVLDWARSRGILSVCADIRGEKSYLEFGWHAPSLLVFGSEGHGLSSEERDRIDESLIIPMENGVESLNVAVACGVILFEAKRQRSLI